MSTESGDILPHGLLALRERNYRLYFIGHLTSQVGTWIEQTAVAWILYKMTDSAILLGLGGVCRAAPTILLAGVRVPSLGSYGRAEKNCC